MSFLKNDFKKIVVLLWLQCINVWWWGGRLGFYSFYPWAWEVEIEVLNLLLLLFGIKGGWQETNCGWEEGRRGEKWRKTTCTIEEVQALSPNRCRQTPTSCEANRAYQQEEIARIFEAWNYLHLGCWTICRKESHFLEAVGIWPSSCDW